MCVNNLPMVVTRQRNGRKSNPRPLIHRSNALGPNLQNILRQSYDYLTIMLKLRSTYDGRLIYEKNLKRFHGKHFVGKIHVKNCNIVGDSVRKLAYDIPERNFSTF